MITLTRSSERILNLMRYRDYRQIRVNVRIRSGYTVQAMLVQLFDWWSFPEKSLWSFPLYISIILELIKNFAKPSSLIIKFFSSSFYCEYLENISLHSNWRSWSRHFFYYPDLLLFSEHIFYSYFPIFFYMYSKVVFHVIHNFMYFFIARLSFFYLSAEWVPDLGHPLNPSVVGTIFPWCSRDGSLSAGCPFERYKNSKRKCEE